MRAEVKKMEDNVTEVKNGPKEARESVKLRDIVKNEKVILK